LHKPRPTLSRKMAPSPPDARSVNVETCGLGRSQPEKPDILEYLYN
jgi:hypothetical protein